MNIEDLPTNGDWTEDDWRQVFPDGGSGDYSGTFDVGLGGARIEDVTAEAIGEVVHFWAVSYDGYGDVDFFAVVKLTDGRYAVSEAWADTTGWGCQADAWWKVGPTLDSVLAELSEANRKHLAESEASE